jgi:LmbE family N-acetylglucosaminyl deacetylase
MTPLLYAPTCGNFRYRDHEAFLTNELVRKIMSLAREVKPDMVLTYLYMDYNPEHVAGPEATVRAISVPAILDT